MRWWLLIFALAACERSRTRMPELDLSCKQGVAYRYRGSDDREARQRMTADGCHDQIVSVLRDDTASIIIGCCPD